MKILYTFFGIIILYVAVELGVLYYRENHLPKLPTIDQSDKTLGSGSVLRYIAAGDSTGVGIGASDLAQTYPYKVARYFAQTNTVQYKNIAIKGDQTSDVLDKQVTQIIAYKPDVVTISIGANDATHLVGETKIIQNYSDIIGKLEKGTTAKIYITNIPNFNNASILPWFFINLIEFRSGYINKQIISLEDARVKIIDIHNFGWANYDRKQTYAADHFHPNDLGYQNWTNAFLDKIRQP